jgi:hypothetical protein
VSGAKRALYHSELRERTEAGPVEVQLLSHPRESKYKGKPPYCRMIFAGEQFERAYEVENDAVRATLEALPINTPLRIVATGSRDEAQIEVHGAPASAAPARREPPPAERAAPAAAAAAESPSLARSYFEALEVAASMVETFKERHGREPTECERSIASALWIEHNRSGGRKSFTGGK